MSPLIWLILKMFFWMRTLITRRGVLWKLDGGWWCAKLLQRLRSSTADDVQYSCQWVAAVLQVVRTSAGDNSVKVKNQSVSGRFFARKGILLSLLSPVPSLNILLQLLVCQVFTDFSDSSDGKNRKTFFHTSKNTSPFTSGNIYSKSRKAPK